MPATPFPVSGIIYDSDNSTPVSGAVVYGRNKQLGTYTSGTSDENGYYIIDLANAGEYTDGNDITIEAIYSNKIKQYQTTIKVSTGFEEVNLTLEQIDSVGLVEDALSSNWNNANTDSIIPVIGKVYDYKELLFSRNDYVLLYETDEVISPFGIGGIDFKHEPTVSIDLKTSFKGTTTMTDVRKHLQKMKEETMRIIKDSILPGASFLLMLPRRKRDLSDKSVGLGRLVIDVSLVKIAS